MQMEEVILVDEADTPLGKMEKMEAHSLVDLVRVIDKVCIPLAQSQSA